ncbi:unnamed protein product [Cladocopium goreaui]|uniref:EF-hand domain-containing protein n=1 Tax=Cladocopium goreaui TaxID=2562237 RepID=A0A9P1CPY8_9DINO|nr:unnamed protein product [Cladocopium goreaui]
MTQAESSEKRSIRLQSLSGGNSSGREPGSPVESLGDKRKEAFFKVQAAKAAQLQRQQEIRVGEEWSEHLKLPANRTPEAMMNFWEEVKIRLLKRFGSLHMAVGGEHSVSFIQFCEILRVIHFPLHQSTCRHIFGQVCGGHREMPVDAFKALLMERTIHSMRFVLEGWNGKQARVRSHIRTFIRRLAEVDERQEEQAVDRFQRKLTASFIRNFWQLLLRKSSSREDVVITQTSLVQALLDPEANCIFQDHEMIYMLRIFEHMMKFRNSLCQTRGENGQSGQNGQSGVPVPGLPMSGYITGLTLVSMIPTKSEKLELIFEAFDLDADHCLLYKQIFELCHCVSVLKVMVEESARGSPDEHFQAELSQQEGQRSYECIRWHLQRRGVPGDIVSFPELRAAWETQPSLQSLLPGWVQIRWAAQALPGEDFSAVFASTFEGKSRQSHTKSRSRRSIQTAPTTGPSREDEWCVSEASRLPGPQGNAAIFKSVLTAKFSKSLRDLGNRRLVELTRDFEVRRRSISRGLTMTDSLPTLKDVKEVSTKDAEAPIFCTIAFISEFRQAGFKLFGSSVGIRCLEKECAKELKSHEFKGISGGTVETVR